MLLWLQECAGPSTHRREFGIRAFRQADTWHRECLSIFPRRIVVVYLSDLPQGYVHTNFFRLPEGPHPTHPATTSCQANVTYMRYLTFIRFKGGAHPLFRIDIF